MTRNEIISDIELRLSKGKPSDDMELSRPQMAFWIDAVRSKMIQDQMASQDSWADAGSGFATEFDCLKIESEDDECDVCDTKKYFVTVPGKIMKLPNDLGVVSVRTPGGSSVNRIRISDLDAIKYIDMIKPSDKNPVYYRVSQKLYILGPNKNFLNKGSLNVFAILASTDSIDDDADFPMSDNLLPALLDAVEVIARRQMSLPADLTNDGKDA